MMNIMKNKDLLELIHKHTHLKDEDGEDVPFFTFVRDIVDTVDFDMSEEQIAEVALENGYKVYKAFPEETMIGGLILCAEGCLKDAIDKMYQEFYGEVPTIEEWPTKEEQVIVEDSKIDLESSEDVLPFKVEKGHTLEEYMKLYGDLYDGGQLWDWDEEDLVVGWEETGSTDFNPFDTFWLIDGRYYEVPEHIKDLKESMTKKEKDAAILKRAGVSAFNTPKRTPKHPKKSHIVVARDGNKTKTIRFGEQGAEVAGKPKAGESERMKAKRKSFRARHNCDTATDKLSARYWACRVKW